jgi:predicted nucleotidyltransferase
MPNTTKHEAAYRATLRRREVEAQQALAARRERAWATARRAAAWLKAHHGVTRVMVFGSLVYNQWFSTRSDIDLAVWGLPDAVYFEAVAHLQDLAAEFTIDLVAVGHCKKSLYEHILEEGIAL